MKREVTINFIFGKFQVTSVQSANLSIWIHSNVTDQSYPVNYQY